MTEKKTSPFRVLFVGKSQKAGSWKVRGEQIAACRSNWSSTLSVKPKDLLKYDMFCCVKHPHHRLLTWAKRLRKVCVYDVIDSWPQPEIYKTCLKRSQAAEYFKGQWRHLDFDGMIFANRRMQEHLGQFAAASVSIYHHYRPGIETNPIRQQVKRVGYEGNAAYLGPWRKIVEEICLRKGWEFVIDPERMADLDIGIAVRGGAYDGYMANAYKSNVKLANFYGSGTPCVVGADEVSYHETDCGRIPFFSTAEQLEAHLTALEPYEKRLELHRELMNFRSLYSIEHIAEQYEAFFLNVLLRRKKLFYAF